jgi:hypothetical protein
VPVTMLLLARLGYFEPIRFFAFGRNWNFSPRTRTVLAAADAAILVFPRPAVFAGAVTVLCTVAVPTSPLVEGWQVPTHAATSGSVVRRQA